MKIVDADRTLLDAAAGGHLASIEALLAQIQPGVYNLAMRMLGQRDDAADAAQEILLKVVTHLGGFRREAAFSTWVYGIARNHLLTALTRRKEAPEVSLDGIAERLQAGLDYAAAHASPSGGDVALTPEDKVAALEVALSCTQGMLMSLDREQRLAWVLDAVFDLSSEQAAAVLGLTPAAYRKRLSRLRGELDPFVRRQCGWVNPDAACRCERQLPAVAAVRIAQGAGGASTAIGALKREELAEAERHFRALVRMGDAAALFRAHPEYRAPETMVPAIRAVLQAEGYWPGRDASSPLQ